MKVSPQLKIELRLSEEEIEVFQGLRLALEDVKDCTDIRDLRPLIASNLPEGYTLYGGGSHIGIHRGNVIDISYRVAIVIEYDAHGPLESKNTFNWQLDADGKPVSLAELRRKAFKPISAY